MTGMDRWIDWSKEFVGSEAAFKEKEGRGPGLKQVTLEVDSVDADANGYEPVWSSGERVGYITSGEYGHVVGKSLAMALVPPELAKPGKQLSTHIVGVRVPGEGDRSFPVRPDRICNAAVIAVPVATATGGFRRLDWQP